MATIFSDSFNRPDGPLSAPWVLPPAYGGVVSNQLQTNSTRTATLADVLSSANHGISVKVYLSAPYTAFTQLYARWDGATGFHYRWRLSYTGTALTVTLYRNIGADVTLYSQVVGNYTFPGWLVIRIAHSGPFHMMWINEALTCGVIDGLHTVGTQVGLYQANASGYFDDFECFETGASAFTVVPGVVNAPGDPVDITLHNGGAPWTPGTPGSPLFLAGDGSLSNQEIVTPDLATATWTPPVVTGVVTIRDPQNNLNYSVQVPATGVSAGGGNGGTESTYDVALQGVGVSPSVWAQLILALIQMFPTDNEPVNDAIAYAVGAKGENPPIVDTALQIYDQGTNVLQELQYGGQPAYTAREEIRAGKNAAIDANAGVSAIRTQQGHTLQTVLDAIAGIAGADLQPVLDELAAIRTPFLYTFSDVTQPLVRVESALATQSDAIGVVNLIVTAIANSLAAYRTGNLYTAQHILDAIAGIPPADLSSVLNAISTHDSDIKASLAAIRTVDNLTLGSVVTSVLDARGTGLPTIKNVLDAVNGLVIPTPEVSIPGMPPVWPGLANVTLGQAIAIDRQMDVVGPMHGILVQLTAVPARAGRKLWGVTESYYQVGNISFYSDNGYYEYPQKLIMQEQVISCHYFTSAAGCAIITREGTTGTVRPWTINPS